MHGNENANARRLVSDFAGVRAATDVNLRNDDQCPSDHVVDFVVVNFFVEGTFQLVLSFDC